MITNKIIYSIIVFINITLPSFNMYFLYLIIITQNLNLEIELGKLNHHSSLNYELPKC